MRFHFAAFLLIASAAAQDVRPKDVREIGKGGSAAIPRLTELLKNPSTDVRVEAVKQLTDARALDALIQATKDNEAEVQIQATDGLVNFYMPGYVQTGFGASIKRVGGSIKGKFTDTNDQIVDPYVTAAPRRDRGARQYRPRRRQHAGPRQCRPRSRDLARQGSRARSRLSPCAPKIPTCSTNR